MSLKNIMDRGRLAEWWKAAIGIAAIPVVIVLVPVLILAILGRIVYGFAIEGEEEPPKEPKNNDVPEEDYTDPVRAIADAGDGRDQITKITRLRPEQGATDGDDEIGTQAGEGGRDRPAGGDEEAG